MSPQGNEAEGDGVAPGKGIKCSLCTKALKKIQALAGDNPDEVRMMRVWGPGRGHVPAAPDLRWLWQAAVTAASEKGCRVLGRTVGKVCQRLVRKYKEQITEGLQNGDMPRDICTAMGICQS